MHGMGNSFRYLCAKNYPHRTWFDIIIEKIKRCSFFCLTGYMDLGLHVNSNIYNLTNSQFCNFLAPAERKLPANLKQSYSCHDPMISILLFVLKSFRGKSARVCDVILLMQCALMVVFIWTIELYSLINHTMFIHLSFDVLVVAGFIRWRWTERKQQLRAASADQRSFKVAARQGRR